MVFDAFYTASQHYDEQGSILLHRVVIFYKLQHIFLKSIMRKIILSICITLSLLTVSCIDDDVTAPQDLEIQDFVWKSMNHWYFWQSDVPNLADAKDDNESDYFNFLRGFSDPEDLFENLKNQSLDDFSWYIDDVEAQLNSFRGISVSYGIELPRTVVRTSAGSDDVVIFVAYVVPNSPADNAGVERGDLIYSVNGVTLTTNNLSEINKIFTETSISLGVANFENGVLTPKGDDVSLTAVEIVENPVHFSSVIERSGTKIGYLVYNGFRSTFHNELNDVFGTFASEGIDELVLDLRYNGGGSVLTSAYLASMIDGSQASGSDFAKLIYNEKRNAENGAIFPFFNNATLFNKETSQSEGTVAINRLSNLSRLYVLTSDKTASASEMIINGLRPSLEVITVGTTTVGKNEGSITVVDAPATSNNQIYTNISGRTSSHTVGMQPIVFQIFNSLDQSDYTNGFEPNIEVNEIDFTANILPFGDENEALLKAAIEAIEGSITKSLKPSVKVHAIGKIPVQKFSQEMYIMPNENIN